MANSAVGGWIASTSVGQLLLAGLAAAAAAWAAWRVNALTADGAVAAAAVGFIVFGWGGAAAAWPLLFFFVTASALTRWSARKRRRLKGRGAQSRAERGRVAPGDARQGDGRNDAAGRRGGQVLANGGVAAAVVLASRLWPDPLWAAAYAGAVATVTADTWATELGVLSKRPPVLITTGRPAAVGQSGAVSAPGTLGGALGAALIAVVSGLAPPVHVYADARASGAADVVVLAVSVGAAGFFGMLFDSLLGAAVERRRIPGTNKVVGNDEVNFLASLAGAAAAVALYGWLGG